MKLLFAEDTEDLNRVVKAMFEHAGYSVDAVFDGEAALESVEKNGYDAVILDIMMPKRDGISVLRAMRERNINLPVLLLTAKAEVDDRVDGLNALLDDVREQYFPGTAGSSLSGAACAAKLADYFAETGMDPDGVYGAVMSYAAALEDEERRTFEQQLDGVVSSFTALTAEGGAGLLADCGYEAAHFPWDAGSVRDCFVALLGSD